MKRLVWLAGCLLLSGLLSGCKEKDLPSVNVFVTADIEGVFWSRPEPRYGNEVTGGLSILKSFLEKQTTPFLLLEGGNWFSQTPEGTLTQGDYFNQVAAGLPYAGRSFTENDLLYGWGALSHLIADSPAPFILSNVVLFNDKLPKGIKPWILKEVGGYKIGVMGLVSEAALQGKQRLGGLKILPELESARQTVEKLRVKGAQVIIVLAAFGTAEDKTTLSERDLAEEVNGIDVIINANVDREETETAYVGKTLLVYPAARLSSVGKLTFSFYKKGDLAGVRFTDVVLYKRDFGENENLSQQVEQVRQSVQKQMNQPVGRSEEVLTGRLEAESALGNWAADCVRKWAKAEGAVINAASLRAPLPAGTITQYDLYKVYPYLDHITYLTIKGAALRQALEEGLAVPDNFAQIAGMQIKYRVLPSGRKKIVSMLVNGVPLNPATAYRIAVTDHILAGGAGHDGFIDSLEFKNTQVEMRTVLRLCLAGKKPVTAPALGRWQELP